MDDYEHQTVRRLRLGAMDSRGDKVERTLGVARHLGLNDDQWALLALEALAETRLSEGTLEEVRRVLKVCSRCHMWCECPKCGNDCVPGCMCQPR